MRKFLKSLLIFVLFVSCFAMAFFVVQEDMSVADAAISKTLLVDEFECYDKGSTYYHFIDIYIESQSNIDHSSGTLYIAKTTSIKFSFSRGAHNHGATLQADGADMAGTVTFYLKNVVTGTFLVLSTLTDITSLESVSYSNHAPLLGITVDDTSLLPDLSIS